MTGRSPHHSPLVLRFLVVVPVAALSFMAALALPDTVDGQDEPAGTTEVSAGPTGLELLQVAPFDKVTLTDNSALLVEPVFPRPLPVYDPAAEAKKKRARREVPAEGNIALPGVKQKKIEVPKGDEDATPPLTIHLLKGEVRDFVVKRSSVKSVEIGRASGRERV